MLWNKGGKMQAIAHFQFLGCAGAALVVLAACTAPAPPPSYDDYVAGWVDKSEVGLVSSWGIPEKTHDLETGGRIVEYARKFEGEVVCTTRFTVNDFGMITKYWYRGRKCLAPRDI
jgi:hypothetical protein